MVAAVLALALLVDTPPDAREIMRRVVANQERLLKVLDDYNYASRRVVRFLDDRGRVKKTEIRTYDVIRIEGTPWRRLIRRDDRPLTAGEARQEQERLDRETRKRQAESPADREKRLRQHQQELQKQQEVRREVLEAFDFRLAGRETLQGTNCLVIEGAPRPGYRARNRQVEFLRHLAGKLWVTEDSYQLVRFEATVVDTVSIGGFLARLNKGGRLMAEQAPVNGEWLPRSAAFKLEARALLLKKFNIESENSYSDYKKFRVDTRVVPLGEPR